MAPIFEKPKVPKAPTPPPENTGEQERIEAAAAAEADRLRKRKGWASTWITGPENAGGPSNGLKTKFGE